MKLIQDPPETFVGELSRLDWDDFDALVLSAESYVKCASQAFSAKKEIATALKAERIQRCENPDISGKAPSKLVLDLVTKLAECTSL